MVAVFGTMAADVLHIGLGIPYLVSTAFFALALTVIFLTWYTTEKTLSAGSRRAAWAAPPVIGGGAIWSLNVEGGRLYALDPATGGVLASISVDALPHFASPTLWGGWVLIGTMSGVVAVKA